MLDRLGELHKMLVNPPSMDGEEDEDAKSECYEVPVWNLNITQFKRVSQKVYLASLSHSLQLQDDKYSGNKYA